MVAGAAAKLQMEGKLDLKNEQEIIMNVADMLSDLFLAESLLLRVEKLAGMTGKVKQEVYDAILRVFIHDATLRMNKNGTDALASFAEGDLLRTMLMGLKRFTKVDPYNLKEARRKVANYVIEKGEYAF